MKANFSGIKWFYCVLLLQHILYTRGSLCIVSENYSDIPACATRAGSPRSLFIFKKSNFILVETEVEGVEVFFFLSLPRPTCGL